MGLGDMLQAQRDAEDAARYRWLRERLIPVSVETVSGSRRWGLQFRIGGDILAVPMKGPNSRADKLDAAIDQERSSPTVGDVSVQG